MSLKDIPAIKPPQSVVYAMGIFLATFIFFFTRPSTEHSEK
jgi:hypothetical protein